MLDALRRFIFGDVRNPDGVPRSPKWETKEKATVKAHPYCSCCGTKDNLEVHHIWPFSWPGGKSLELIDDNLIVVCRTCHFLICHLLDWKSRNSDVRQDCARIYAKIKARPYPEK